MNYPAAELQGIRIQKNFQILTPVFCILLRNKVKKTQQAFLLAVWLWGIRPK